MTVSPMFAALAAALLATAPSAAQQRAVPPLTAADTNRIITVRAGRVLAVDLQQSAGTGSSWRMVPATGLVQVGPPIVTRGSAPVAGGPERHTFHVRVTQAGEFALTFVNARTFGGPDQAAETATFIIDAK